MIRAFIVGFATTFKHIFKRPITVNYPDQKVPVFPKYRGKQVLMRDENGLEKCVACGLCAVACPADAIYLEAAENDGSVQAGPRYAKVYQIHKTRCIFCGYCEDACPVQAIVLGPEYELSDTSREKFIYTKEKLLEPLPPDVQARLDSKGPQ
jgi:NADH-quinone oxidoreductase subunit I